MTSNPLTLNDYGAFHSMLCPPRIARRCIDSTVGTGGIVLFMPSDYHFRHPVGDRHPHDGTDILTVLTYYLLVLYTLTGLCTLLGLTELVHASDFLGDEGRGVVIPPDESLLRSDLDPECVLVVDSDAMKYVAHRAGVERADLRLRRRFEYRFWPLGIHVMMLHLTSPMEAAEEVAALHLIEVYHIENPILRYIVHRINLLVLFFFDVVSEKRGRYDMNRESKKDA